MVVKIPISRGKYFALVDEADAERVQAYSWRRIPGGAAGAYYAEGTVRGVRVKMHRFILGDEAWSVTDHKDGDGLNNTRANLRPCTAKQNSRNVTRLPTTNKSGVLGVSRNGKYWKASISVNGKQLYLGDFKTLVEAASVRRGAELMYFGEYAPHVNRHLDPRPWFRILRTKKPPKPKYVKKVRPPKLTLAERQAYRAAGKAEWLAAAREYMQDDLIPL